MPLVLSTVPYGSTLAPLDATSPTYLWTLPSGGGSFVPGTNTTPSCSVIWGAGIGTYPLRLTVTTPSPCANTTFDEEPIILTCNSPEITSWSQTDTPQQISILFSGDNFNANTRWQYSIGPTWGASIGGANLMSTPFIWLDTCGGEEGYVISVRVYDHINPSCQSYYLNITATNSRTVCSAPTSMNVVPDANPNAGDLVTFSLASIVGGTSSEYRKLWSVSGAGTIIGSISGDTANVQFGSTPGDLAVVSCTVFCHCDQSGETLTESEFITLQ